MTQTHLVHSAADGRVAGARSAPPGQRPTWAQIDLDAIRHNTAALKAQAAAPGLMAVVKADGYGHGLEPSARAALAGGADWLGVALVEEGVALRNAGIVVPVLVLSEPPPEAIPALLDASLTATVYSPAFLAALDAAGRDRDAGPVPIHLKLDTGMRRVGVPQADWPEALEQVRSAAGVDLEALWSHFAVADEPGHPFTDHQAREFARACALAESMGLRPRMTHLCNSAGTLAHHDHHRDMVRPGVALYGLDPGSGLAPEGLLRPALSWFSRLSLVKRLAAGEAVSYGLEWTAAADSTVGTVPAGYADGVNRRLSGRGEVLVRGRRVPIAGRVCMDQFVVTGGDLELMAGDEVTLIGRQGHGCVTADDWAAWLGTINYEIVCSVGRRVPRVYIGGD